MTMSESQPNEEPSGHLTLMAENITVVDSGRLTIPAQYRNRLNINEGDILHCVFYTDDHAVIQQDTVVLDGGQVTIRKLKRQLYGIEDGDVIDFEAATTGMTKPDTED